MPTEYIGYWCSSKLCITVLHFSVSIIMHGIINSFTDCDSTLFADDTEAHFFQHDPSFAQEKANYDLQRSLKTRFGEHRHTL